MTRATRTERKKRLYTKVSEVLPRTQSDSNRAGACAGGENEDCLRLLVCSGILGNRHLLFLGPLSIGAGMEEDAAPTVGDAGSVVSDPVLPSAVSTSDGDQVVTAAEEKTDPPPDAVAAPMETTPTETPEEAAVTTDTEFPTEETASERNSVAEGQTDDTENGGLEGEMDDAALREAK